MNLRNFNPRKIKFLVSFLYKTTFAAPTHPTRLLSKDVEFYCASFDRSEKFVASCPPMETPTQKLKNQFPGRNSQGIYPNLEYFGMILKALQTLLLKIKIHPSVKKTPKSSEFSLRIYNNETKLRSHISCFSSSNLCINSRLVYMNVYI